MPMRICIFFFLAHSLSRPIILSPFRRCRPLTEFRRFILLSVDGGSLTYLVIKIVSIEEGLLSPSSRLASRFSSSDNGWHARCILLFLVFFFFDFLGLCFFISFVFFFFFFLKKGKQKGNRQKDITLVPLSAACCCWLCW